MKQRMFVLAGLIALTMLLSGCLGGGGGSGSNGGSAGIGGADMAGLPGGGVGAGGNGGGGIDGNINPEPATVLLLGGGLAAYAFIKRRKLK